MKKSTTQGKPNKPYKDFPLYPHTTKRWAKKIRGKTHYFGRWDDPDAALQKYLDQRDELQAGREPRSAGKGLMVKDLCNEWLAHKKQLLDCGELAQRTFEAYLSSAGFLAASLGRNTLVDQLGPADFQALRGGMTKSWGPIRLKNEMGVVESIFRYGDRAGLYEKRICFGPAWTKPSAKTLRKQRAANGPRMFGHENLLKVLEHASTNMRAMILLGANAALGNTELGLLPIKAMDLDAGWLDYPRAKTGIDRRVPLWPETVAAIRRVLAERREPNDPTDCSLLFIGKRGKSYVGNHRGHRVCQEFDRTMRWAGVEGRSFYDLRRTFQTIGEEARDLVAVQSIMGHAPPAGDMSAIYRQRISDDRLQAVTDHVHAWLFGSCSKE